MHLRVLLEVVHTAFEVFKQQRCHVFTDTMADHDALNNGILSVSWKRVRGYLPTTHTHAIRKVIESETPVAFFQAIAERR